MRAVDPRSGLPTLLVQVDALFTEMRSLLSATGMTSTGTQSIPVGLLDSIVAFEAAADDFNIDVQRYKKLLQPAQYRDALSQNSDELYRLAQVLHDQLQQQRDTRKPTDCPTTRDAMATDSVTAERGLSAWTVSGQNGDVVRKLPADAAAIDADCIIAVAIEAWKSIDSKTQ